MSGRSNSFRSTEEQVTKSFDAALAEARSKVDLAKAKALEKLKA